MLGPLRRNSTRNLPVDVHLLYHHYVSNTQPMVVPGESTNQPGDVKIKCS